MSLSRYCFVMSTPLADNGLERERLITEDLVVGFGFNESLWPGRKDAVSLRRDSSAMLGMTLRVRFLRYGRNDRWGGRNELCQKSTQA